MHAHTTKKEIIMKRFLAIILLLASYSAALCAKNSITDYEPVFLPVYTTQGDLKIAIRVFKMNDQPSFLIVNPINLQTSVVPIAQLLPRNTVQKKKPGYFSEWLVASTNYYQLLNKNTSAPYLFENHGVKHADNSSEGNILTIDLCPSSKRFEAKFFNSLIQKSEKIGKPVPVTIAISGQWLIEHPQEFQWLIKQEKEQKLSITWANHSFSHIYYNDQPYSKNFLLTPGTNIKLEILSTEKYLLEAGEVPSIFFRFPGLIANKKLILKLRNYGLIPLGADAWLAKNQPITAGGVILVHGNSNEPLGIVKIMPLIPTLDLIDIKTAL